MNRVTHRLSVKTAEPLGAYHCKQARRAGIWQKLAAKSGAISQYQFTCPFTPVINKKAIKCIIIYIKMKFGAILILGNDASRNSKALCRGIVGGDAWRVQTGGH
jgi:hypothetical protein